MKKDFLTAFLVTIGLLVFSAPLFAQGPRFQITVTNLTAAETFTPVLVATAKREVRIFELGQHASLELQHLAEAGDTSQLTATLEADPKVLDVVTAGGVPPGGSETIMVKAHARFDHVIVASMLVPTNAGFFALNGVKGPKGNGTITLFSVAYDAGSKPDDELCANIPGPPTVCNGTGFVPEETGCNNAPGCVGYVLVHRGIHGIGDLDASTYDWRNPVAEIVIKRAP